MARIPVTIDLGGHTGEGWLEDETEVGGILAARLPFVVDLTRWGDEYYGPCDAGNPTITDTTEVVEIGDLAYWPPGDALCLFFGPTPASHADEPRAASPVEVIGHLDADVGVLRALPSRVTLEAEPA